MPEVATPNQGEREFETGTDEFFKHQSQVNAGHSNMVFANIKRTYDASRSSRSGAIARLSIWTKKPSRVSTTRTRPIR